VELTQKSVVCEDRKFRDLNGLRSELAGEPGFEPGLTESESVGLPLTYSPTGAEGWPRSVRACFSFKRAR
jgi:hypothetical protein